MTLQQLRYIIKIVACGSINEAAKQLYITQPSLSNAVKELENEMGIAIFKRSAKGISLTLDGAEFLSYARQVVEQSELLEQRYIDKTPLPQLFAISTQHYAFAVNAFVSLIEQADTEEYTFTLRETKTYDIIEDVSTFRSEIGILYLSAFNRNIIMKLLNEKHLIFHPLFIAKPHVFLSKQHPLVTLPHVTMKDLEEYPYLSFEQGEYNSFYFAEEILSTVHHKKSIHVSDRATLFNLLIGLQGYTICSGVLNNNLNGDQILAKPLVTDETMEIGWIMHSKTVLHALGNTYINNLKKYIQEYGYTILKTS